MSRTRIRTRSLGAVTALAATAVVLTACNDPGQPDTAPASVDPASLDTGSYPTAPRPAFGRPDDSMVLEVEGQRMADFVVAPFEIDPDLTSSAQPTGIIIGQNRIAMLVAGDVAEVPANADILSGFTSAATTEPRAGDKRVLINAVLRYKTPEAAANAAAQMAEATAAQDGQRAGSLPGKPATRIVTGPSADKKGTATQAFTAHRMYVLYQWYEVAAGDAKTVDPILTRTITRQTALINRFPRVLTKAEAAAGVPDPHKGRPQMDQNSILIYALPVDDREIKESGPDGSRLRAVYGPRGMAHFSGDSAETYRLLTDVGAEHTAYEKSNVYRTADPQQAQRLVQAKIAAHKDTGDTAVEAPQNLPGVSCVRGNGGVEGHGAQTVCLVHNGRYVGEVSSDDEADAAQQTAAQYLILTGADQNAR